MLDINEYPNGEVQAIELEDLLGKSVFIEPFIKPVPNTDYAVVDINAILADPLNNEDLSEILTQLFDLLAEAVAIVVRRYRLIGLNVDHLGNELVPNVDWLPFTKVINSNFTVALIAGRRADLSYSIYPRSWVNL